MRNYVKELAKSFRENDLMLDSSEDAALKEEWESFRSIFLKEAQVISPLIGTAIPFRADVLMLHGDFWDKLSWEAQSFLLSDEHWSREDRKERLNIIREFAQKFPEKGQAVQDFEKALLDLEKSDVVKMMD